MFALLNKYSKIVEIPKSHLCIPVQCVQSNYVNTVVSHVNSKETVFIYQGRNMGLQISKLPRDAVSCWGLWCSARMPESPRTLTFAGSSVPQWCGEPNCLVNLPISLTVPLPGFAMMANNRENKWKGKAGLHTHHTKLQFKYWLLWGSCFGVLVQLPCILFGSGLLLQIIMGNTLLTSVWQVLRQIINNSWWELWAAEDRGQKETFCNFLRVLYKDPDNMEQR